MENSLLLGDPILKHIMVFNIIMNIPSHWLTSSFTFQNVFALSDLVLYDR